MLDLKGEVVDQVFPQMVFEDERSGELVDEFPGPTSVLRVCDRKRVRVEGIENDLVGLLINVYLLVSMLQRVVMSLIDSENLEDVQGVGGGHHHRHPVRRGLAFGRHEVNRIRPVESRGTDVGSLRDIDEGVVSRAVNNALQPLGFLRRACCFGFRLLVFTSS